MSGTYVTTATRAAPNVAYYGSGGGGGGGTNFNDITVSSITFSGNPTPAYDITFPGGYTANIGADITNWQTVDAGGGIFLLDLSGNQTSTNNPGFILQGNGAASVEITAGAETAITLDGGNYLSIDTCIPNIYRAQFVDGGLPAAPGMTSIANLTATAASGMTLTDSNANQFIFNCSSINVSSINGQAPAGGSQNLSLNTITFAGASNPSLYMENRAIQFNGAASAASIGLATMFWNNSASNLNVIAPSTSSVFVGTEQLTGYLIVEDSGVYAHPFLSTPNLQVSSINGAVYPPGGTVTSVALSNFSGDQAVIPLSNVAYPLSDNFNITGGHTYRISANLGFNNVDGSGTRTDIVVSGGGAGFPVFITTKSNTDLIPGLSGQSGGYSTVFLASANASVQVVGYNTSTTAGTTVQVQSASSKWVLEDLGTL